MYLKLRCVSYLRRNLKNLHNVNFTQMNFEFFVVISLNPHIPVQVLRVVNVMGKEFLHSPPYAIPRTL